MSGCLGGQLPPIVPNWANGAQVHRSEHTSLILAVKAIKKAAKRAELLRKGPGH